jgi:hypothetical protein
MEALVDLIGLIIEGIGALADIIVALFDYKSGDRK